MTSVSTSDVVSVGFDNLPYDIYHDAVERASDALRGTYYDYVYTMVFDDAADTYTFSLYYGYGLRLNNDYLYFPDDVHLREITYTVQSQAVPNTPTVSGSQSGTVAGQGVSGFSGTFSGTVNAVRYIFTVTRESALYDASDVVFDDETGFLYSSHENYMHLNRGVEYETLAGCFVVPLLVCALAMGLFIHIYRRFG